MRYELHGGSISDITWASQNGIDAVGLITVPDGNVHSDIVTDAHKAGIEAHINIFNNGEAPIGTQGTDYEAYIAALASEGWDAIAGDSVSRDVVATVRKYTPFINHGGDLGGRQLDAYYLPWGHPVEADQIVHNYIYTWSYYPDGRISTTTDSTISALQTAASIGTADSRLGIVISNVLPATVQTWINLITKAEQIGITIDTIVFSADIDTDIINEVQTGVFS